MDAAEVERVRAESEAMAACDTNRSLATRFCVTAYSDQPSEAGFRPLPAPLIDPTDRRRLGTRSAGTGAIEGYTSRHDRRNEPVDAVATCLLGYGVRASARLTGSGKIKVMLEADPIGRRILFEDASKRLA